MGIHGAMGDAGMRDGTKAQSGMSLLETLIYASLTMLLIVIAMRSLGTVQSGAAKSGESGRMQGEAEEAVQVMGRDLRNMGLKHLFYEAAPGDFIDTVLPQATYVPGDSSSFLHRDGNPFDTLTFLRARLNAAGNPSGVDTVTYQVDPATRVLSRTVKGSPATGICSRVEALQFAYGVSAQKTVFVSESPPALAHWASSPAGTLSLSGPSLVASLAAAGSVTFWQSASPFATSAVRRYAFDFQGLGDAGLASGSGSLEAVVCTPAGTVVAAESLKVETSARDYHLEMDAPACASCRAGFKMRLPSAGKLYLSKIRFSEISQGDLAWAETPTLVQKKSTRAVRVYLLVGSGNSMFGAHTDTMTLANAGLHFADGKGRSLLDEIIPTPNNGP